MASQKIELAPFPVPKEAHLVLPPRPRQDGFKPSQGIPIEELDRDAVDELAAQWLGALYACRNEGNPFIIGSFVDQ